MGGSGNIYKLDRLNITPPSPQARRTCVANLTVMTQIFTPQNNELLAS
jgi:hypothetical protein